MAAPYDPTASVPSDEIGQGADDAAGGRYWGLRGGLLLAWAAVSFGTCYFARDLFALVGQPLGYWMASQGILVVFILIVVVYATVVNRHERRRLAGGDRSAAEAQAGG